MSNNTIQLLFCKTLEMTSFFCVLSMHEICFSTKACAFYAKMSEKMTQTKGKTFLDFGYG